MKHIVQIALDNAFVSGDIAAFSETRTLVKLVLRGCVKVTGNVEVFAGHLNLEPVLPGRLSNWVI